MQKTSPLLIPTAETGIVLFENLDEMYSNNVTDGRILPDNSHHRLDIWDADTLVGSATLIEKDETAEVDIWLDEDYRGYGYATIAAQALGQYAAQTSRTATSRVYSDNQKGMAVFERAGYRKVSLAQEAGKIFFEFGEAKKEQRLDLGVLKCMASNGSEGGRYEQQRLGSQLRCLRPDDKKICRHER